MQTAWAGQGDAHAYSCLLTPGSRMGDSGQFTACPWAVLTFQQGGKGCCSTSEGKALPAFQGQQVAGSQHRLLLMHKQHRRALPAPQQGGCAPSLSADVCDSCLASWASREAKTVMWGEGTALPGKEAEPLPPSTALQEPPALTRNQAGYLPFALDLAWTHALFPRFL